MSSSKRKYELAVPLHEVSTFLRSLADALEKNETVIPGYEVDLTDYRKLKISFKPNVENTVIKLRIKTLQSVEDVTHDDQEELAFSSLKKRMKSYYKDLSETLEAGGQPSREIVSVFLQDSKTMTSYPEMGEEYYSEYLQACQDFQQAYEAEDMQRMQETFSRIESLKDRCHDKYK